MYQHLYDLGVFSFGLYAHLAFMLGITSDRIHHHKAWWAWWGQVVRFPNPLLDFQVRRGLCLGEGASRWQKHFVIYVQQVAIAEAGLATFAEGILAIVTAWTSSH